MKKLILIAAAAALAGCGSGESTESLERELSCTAVMTAGETEYEARLERADGENGEGAYNFTFTSPESISGVTVSLVGENCTLSLGELSETWPVSELPAHGMLVLFSEACDEALDGELTGRVRGISYTAQAEDGHLTKIEFIDGTTFELT